MPRGRKLGIKTEPQFNSLPVFDGGARGISAEGFLPDPLTKRD